MKFQVGHQQQVNDVERLAQVDDENPSVRRRQNELPRGNRNLSAVGEVDDEMLKWFGLVGGSDLFERHGRVLEKFRRAYETGPLSTVHAENQGQRRGHDLVRPA